MNFGGLSKLRLVRKSGSFLGLHLTRKRTLPRYKRSDRVKSSNPRSKDQSYDIYSTTFSPRKNKKGGGHRQRTSYLQSSECPICCNSSSSTEEEMIYCSLGSNCTDMTAPVIKKTTTREKNRRKKSSFRESAGGQSNSASVEEFIDIVNSHFKNYLNFSNQIGGDVAKHASMVSEAIEAQKAFLIIASKSKKPGSETTTMELLKPTSDKISNIISFRESNRRSEFFNHLSAISESIPALGWVTVSPAPSPFVKEMNDAGQFYTNRVLKDFKAKAPIHVDWVKSWVAFLTELQAFVKKNHTTGLVWNPKGVEATAVAPPPPPAGGPPLPPPPPPPGLFDDINEKGGDKDTSARNALLDQLNKGSDITKGLKKVTSDMQTHKNPSLRGAGTVGPTTKSASPAKSFGSAISKVSKPPKFDLEGKKWVIEYQKDNAGLTVRDTEVNQSIYAYKCEGCVLQVKGKINNIILDSCKKTSVVFDSVVSSCEFVNCQSIKMQVMGKVPTISIDKTDGCQMFLSQESNDVVIVSAKSSEMNVLVSNGEDYVEYPIAEQFKTTISGKKLITVPTESV